MAAPLNMNTLFFCSSRCSSHLRVSPAMLLPSASRFPPHRLVIAASEPRSGGGTRRDPELSVLRFTLGIPGLDESYLPRYIGAAFGSLLLLNHFVGTNGDVTEAQMRTEVVGLCLAAFSILLPYVGRFLKGATQTDRSILPAGNSQLFLMTKDIPDNLKEDFAWSTFVLLRNTNTMSVILQVRGALCVRGYWRARGDDSKNDTIDWFKREIQQMGLSNLEDTLYFPQINGQLWNILPNGAASVLVEPLIGDSYQNECGKMDGFLMLVSSSSYAYANTDRAWIKAIANKFQGLNGFEDGPLRKRST